jgi:hypothetical protein
MPPADEPVVTPAAPSAPAPETTVTPAEATPPASTTPESPTVEPAATPVTEPSAETPPVEAPAEAPPAEAEKPKLHTDTATLLEGAGKSEAPTEGAAPVEAAQPVARTYEAFTLPEGVTLDQERIAAANQLFASHNLPQETAQQLVDFHIAEMQRYDAATLQNQHDTFDQYRAAERARVMADPEIGGSGHATAMTAIAKMRDLFASSAKPGTEKYERDMAEFNDGLRTTGAGDMPWLLRLLHNVARRFDEPIAPSVSYRPPPDIGRRPTATNRRQAMYGEVQPGPNGRG